MKKYRIVSEQSDELTALFARADSSLAIVEGLEYWLDEGIDPRQFLELEPERTPNALNGKPLSVENWKR